MSSPLRQTPPVPPPVRPTTQAEIDFIYDQDGIQLPPGRPNIKNMPETFRQRDPHDLEESTIRSRTMELTDEVRKIHAEQDQVQMELRVLEREIGSGSEGSDMEAVGELRGELERLNEQLVEMEADICGLMRESLKCCLKEVLQGSDEERPTFCKFVDTDGKQAQLSADSVLRFILANDCTEEFIDFALSPAGLCLRHKERDASRCRTLTVTQGRRLLGAHTSKEAQRSVAEDIGLANLDYALVPIVKNYHEPYESKLSRVLFTHVYFVILCGMRGGKKFVIWSDAMWLKPTPSNVTGEEDVFINFARCTSHRSSHLGISDIRKRFVQLMQDLSPETWGYQIRMSDVACRFLRVPSYENFGSGVALVRGAVTFMRKPHEFMKHIKEGGDGTVLGVNEDSPDFSHSGWAKIWRGIPEEQELGNDAEEGYTDVAQATLILAYKLIRAYETGGTGPANIVPHQFMPTTVNGFGIPKDIPEDDVDLHLHTRALIKAWKPWLFLQKNVLNSRVLFYAAFHEEYDEVDTSHHFVIPLAPRRRRLRQRGEPRLSRRQQNLRLRARGLPPLPIN